MEQVNLYSTSKLDELQFQDELEVDIPVSDEAPTVKKGTWKGSLQELRMERG